MYKTSGTTNQIHVIEVKINTKLNVDKIDLCVNINSTSHYRIR